MLKVETAGLNCVKVLVEAPPALVGVCTMSLVHRRTHKKPAVNRRTAVKMAALWEYRHSFLRPTERPTMTLDFARGFVEFDQHLEKRLSSEAVIQFG